MNRFKRSNALQRKQNIHASLICLIGIGLNMVLGYVVTVFELPIYLDTVGTVGVAAVGGYLPGVIVGFVTNVIKSIYDPSSLYYGVLNVLIAVAASYLAGRGLFKKLYGIPINILVFTFIGGGLGALIPWYMEGLSFDSESLSGILYQTGYFNQAVSHIFSSLIMDLPDKAVTVIMVTVIIRFVPEKIRHYFSFNMWLQKPSANDGEILKNEKKYVRVMSLKTKTLLVLIASLIIVSFVGTFIGLKVYRNMTTTEHTNLARGTATFAASMINGDRIEEYLATSGKTQDYSDTKHVLEKLISSSKEIAYLYVYQIHEDGVHVVFDIDTEAEQGKAAGSVIPLDKAFVPYLSKFLAGEEMDPIITDDEYGNLLTVAIPVFDSNDRCVCYAIADVDMEVIIANERSFLMENISVFLGFFILICTFVVYLMNYHILIPVRSVTDRVEEFTYTEEAQEQLDAYVKELRDLGIHTGDELERLYHTICAMTLNQAEQMRELRHYTEATSQMQNGLIVTMADMVESRDSDTGAHVQKTAAYVKIILDGLERKGYYAEKLTPGYISEVVVSAPLHDVGKINVPDAVLNKPGKLSNEEYQIIKTHTTAGREIIERAMDTVHGENYLMEARNMAAYHHERWDGKGYPEGLHGEGIPLSARVMAVADVFDALSSPRVYKPGFPLEKALRIINEGSGTQFDPKCVEVFMDSLDEVKAILKKYSENNEENKQ